MKSEELLKGEIEINNKTYQFEKAERTIDTAGKGRLRIYFQRKLVGFIPIETYGMLIESEKYLLFNPETHTYTIVPTQEERTKYIKNNYIVINPDLSADMLT